MVSFDEKDQFALQRAQMVEHHLRGRDIRDPAVLRAMGRVPREDFVPQAYRSQAYADHPLPIGVGQTISQPYIVALMTQCLRPGRDCDILEVGTGSGYQTAILAELSARVFTIERHHELSEQAQTNLEKQGVINVEFAIGDGSRGWPGERQFDRIILTAAVPSIPLPLARQLKSGGVLVAPVGSGPVQDLAVYDKRGEELVGQIICGCRFVPLIGEFGFRE